MVKIETRPAKTLNVKGLPVSYTTLGKGKTALLTFSLATDKGVIISDVHKSLAETARLIIVQFPDVSDLDGVIEVSLAVLQAEKIAKAIWWGSSIGGAIALYAGIRCPENVSGLTIANSALPVRAAYPATFLALGFLKMLSEKFLISQLLKKTKKADAYFDTTQFSQALKKNDLLNWVRWATFYHGLGVKPFIPLQASQIPILIIECKDDPGAPGWARNTLKSFFPEARVKTFQDGGHFPQVAHRAEFETALVEFIATISG